ncbi:MAG: DMT family transporter [Rickettsiales bacterium]|jgi:drug/metabolite transporter (DMT)-like permease|nr:DMT family transporter [Rickettsiales bacterium]
MNKGTGVAIIVMLAFGLSSIFYKIFYMMGFNSISLSLYVPLFAVLALFFQKFFVEKNLRFLKISRRDFLLSFVNAGIVGLFVINVSIILALQYISVGIQQLITNCNPIMTLLIYTIILRRTPKKQDIISCLLILLGLYFVVGEINVEQNRENLVGLFFCFTSMTGIAVYSTIIGENPTNYDDVTFWLYAFLGYLTASLTKVFITNDFGSIIPFTSLSSLAFIFFAVYFSCATPYILYKVSMHKIGVMKTLIIISFSPVVSLILDYLFFGVSITLQQCLGFVVVLLALITPVFVKK